MKPTPGLLNPANAVVSSGGFKEGIVRIDTSMFKVHQGRAGEGGEVRNPVLAMVWHVTRFDQDGEPLHDDDNNPVTEEIVFSLGGKSLAHAHPGTADSPDDENVEDAGVAPGAEGPTLFIINPSWRPDSKSAIVNLQDSLKAKGVRPETLDRIWAPDYVGAVVLLKSKPSGQTIERPNAKTGVIEAQTFSYKIVDGITKGFGLTPVGKKAQAQAALVSQPKSSKANGKPTDSDEAEASLKPILDKISEEYTGKSMTKKALAATVNRMIGDKTAFDVPPPLVLPIMTMVRDDSWLTANGAKFDFSFDASANQVSFT